MLHSKAASDMTIVAQKKSRLLALLIGCERPQITVDIQGIVSLGISTDLP